MEACVSATVASAVSQGHGNTPSLSTKHSQKTKNTAHRPKDRVTASSIHTKKSTNRLTCANVCEKHCIYSIKNSHSRQNCIS
jgi:hypothetical protein